MATQESLSRLLEKANILRGLKDIGRILSDMPESPEKRAIMSAWLPTVEPILQSGPLEFEEPASASAH